MKLALLLILAAAIAAAAYIRLAPSDPARWHVDPLAADDPGPKGALRRLAVDASPEAALRRFDDIARAAPRTRVLAGSPAEGRVTYVARSKWLGFPDYVTATAIPDAEAAVIVALSRQRFGRSDFGVNAARLDRWLQAVQATQQ